ncbi:MAG TPA: energy-coupling factor transporter transmembrane component T, partial [Desulfobaccales bacterium]|nr:energy-coupling factor transporter transmembrane component T [Desulfobaccales bacterium]
MQGNNFLGVHPAPTLIHRLDPRTKLFLLAASFVVVLLPESPQVVVLATLAVLGHVTLARAWRALVPIRWLLVALALFSLGVWSWMAQGPNLLFWRVSWESLAFGAANFLKLGTMMVAGLTLLATTPVEELFLGLVKLRLPYPAAFAFALALRWVPEVFATALQVKEAQAARGLHWEGGNPLDRLKRHLPLLAPIFLLTLRRSQAMAWALEARGFQMSP